jgi:2,2-dialkylglycine decarboxylase (pyruvate)
VIVPPPGYFKALRGELDRRGMLLIFDESQTGLGKTGKLFGFQHEDAVPDIITISKHFGGGLPISAVCTTADIAERAVKAGYFATRSHATDPILCAAGEESLDIVVDEDMPGKAARIERRIKDALGEMANEFELIGDIRGRGVLLGVEFVTDREKKTPANAEVGRIASYCLEHGLIFQLRGTQGDLNVIRLVPPMVSTDADVDHAMSILRDGIAMVSRARPAISRAAE